MSDIHEPSVHAVSADTPAPPPSPAPHPAPTPTPTPAPAPVYGPEGNTEPWTPKLPADAPPGAYCRVGNIWVDRDGQPIRNGG